MNKQQLWHFTPEIYLPLILSEGLRRNLAVGDALAEASVFCRPSLAEIQERDAIVAVEESGIWLTDKPKAAVQQWSQWTTDLDKTAVRIKIRVPQEELARVRRWRDLVAQYRISRDFYRIMDARGGHQAQHWWICQGDIPRAWIVGVEVRGRPVDLIADLPRLWLRRRAELCRLLRLYGALPVDLRLAEGEVAPTMEEAQRTNRAATTC